MAVITVGQMSEAFSLTQSPRTKIDNNTKIESCTALENDTTTKENNIGFYYYRLALCKYVNEPIKNEKSLLGIISLFNKSAQNNYPLANFALGLIYDAKYKMGSKIFGVLGKPDDIKVAIKNYEIAANAGSSKAQNNLGEIYLHEANINNDLKVTDNGKDVKNTEAIIKLPDIHKAIYWLQLAAQHGDPAAQGTLADLYRQGIGVVQDYTLAYVWFNLSYTSQTSFNDIIYEEITNNTLATMQKERDEVYKLLTENQKDQAQELSKEYKKKFFHSPTNFDKACWHAQKFISLKNASTLFSILENARDEFQNSITHHLISLCGAKYHLAGNNLIITVEQSQTLKSLPEALKYTDVIYSSKASLSELKSH